MGQNGAGPWGLTLVLFLLVSLPPKGQDCIEALGFLMWLLTQNLSFNVLVTEMLPRSDTFHPPRAPLVPALSVPH